ncbi:MAG: DNA primase [Proteobacteria bacterium]|nr:DNA primase [Pseudomonadota bacterium]
MARIPEQFIDELISRSDIAELIDHRVPLQRAGSEFRACCPFHNEKTPSFYVSPAKQFYHCFGCGAHGTVISFLMNYDNMEFLDAVDVLASQAGMQVPKDAQPDDKSRRKQAALYDIVERANRWYQLQLKQHPDARQAIDYLKERGLDGKTAAEFGVGFAPDGWDNLIKALGQEPQDLERMAEAGLVIKKDEGGYYDRFRGRVMFPIEDHRGKLVGFGGRVMGKGEPKYLNSPETPLFHKGSELYGLYRARREMGKLDESVVVEGYMDVVGLAQNGVDNSVATLGTATTPVHLQRLFRAASRVVFCFDGDRAGRKAAWRALEVALPFMEDGRQIKFLLMPEGEDPDSLIRKEGKQAFLQRLENSLSLDTFLFSGLTARLDLSQMDQRARLASLARPLLQKLPQGDFKSMMYAHLGELVGVAQHEVQAVPPAPPPVARPEKTEQAEAVSQLSPHVRDSLRLLLQFPELIEVANEFELNADNDSWLDMLDQLIGMINVNPQINTARLVERLRFHAQYSILAKLAADDFDLEEDKRQHHLRDLMSRIDLISLQKQVTGLLSITAERKFTAEEHKRLNNLYAQMNRYKQSGRDENAT